MDNREARKRGLSKTRVFRDMPDEVVGAIAEVAETKVLPAGTTVFKRGDPGDSFCVVYSGKVRVYRSDEEGVELTLSELGPGDSFGEMALLTGEPRSANVETLEETHLLVLPKDQFDRVLKSHPDVSLTFIRQLSGWLKRDEQALVMEAKRLATPPRLSWFDFVLVVGVSILFALIFNQSNPNGISLFPKIPSQEAIQAIEMSAALEEHSQGQTLFLDAMPSNFYDKRHIKDSVNMPLSLFEIVYMMVLEQEDKSRKIIVYGRTISRLYDLEVANKLILRGYKNVKVLKGTLTDWEEKGHPVGP
ncbi:MAG: cyclic nucleotide-binding domain-containing protein [Proteobacteria bacterium]|nr:cyclic nucleotide-binding domain-containing protein [Pseudomonadota bacterium]